MISVIIPTFKNKQLLIDNLNHNLPYLQDCEIIIVNDDPTESLKKDIKKFKKIILFENKKNLGFGQSINIGAKKARGNYLMFLNNDVQLSNDNYQLAINHFENNENMFSVSFAQTEKNGTIVGKNKIYWQKGFFQHSSVNNLNQGINGWAEGGSCIIDKKKFKILGGFDPIYSPFYWEDIDLSYRAWKTGYENIFNPEIKVIHHHESTIGKYFSNSRIKSIAFRNQLLFIWKNINTNNLIKEHVIYLVPAVLKGGLPFISGFFQALFKLPQIKKLNNNIKLSDLEIFNKFL